MSDTYGDVDAADDVAGAIAWQERVDAWPAIAAYKRRMDERCGPAGPVLDVGAGPGLDARRIGAVALDRSRAMARRGVVPSIVGDALALPVASGSLGAVRADRVLQHLDAPAGAVAEMVRCLHPGGRIVVCDPDQETLRIAVPGVPDDLVERVRRLRRDVGYRSGTYVTALPDWLADLGCTDVTVEPFPLVLDDPDDAFGLAGWPRYWADRHGFTPDECALWADAVADARHAGFRYALDYVVVAGTAPTG